MSAHIWQRKSTKFASTTKDLAKLLYASALKVGYSPIESARYAAQYIERKMQGNNSCPLSRAGHLHIYMGQTTLPTKEQLSSHKAVVPTQKPLDWQLGCGVHASEFLYFRIIGAPLPEDDGRANLPHVLANIQKHKPKDYTRISAAMAGVDAISPDLYIVKTAMASCGAMHRQSQLAWAQIKRGRDLFIAGFGTFDINAAVDWVNANPHCGCFSPMHLTAIGYCLAWQVEEQDWDKVIRLLCFTPHISAYHARWGRAVAQATVNHQMAMRTYFVQNIAYWRHNIHHLDALRYHNSDRNGPLTQWLAQWADNPAGLVAQFTAGRADQPTYAPPIYNNDQLAYMADWQPQDVMLPVDDVLLPHTVEAITTIEDLDASAKALRNCSRGYIYRMVKQDTVLCVVRNQRGKRVAMLELSPPRLAPSRADTYCQMRGPCNKPLPAGWSYPIRKTAPYFVTALDTARRLVTPASSPESLLSVG
jgi:hypothetical protein